MGTYGVFWWCCLNLGYTSFEMFLIASDNHFFRGKFKVEILKDMHVVYDVHSIYEQCYIVCKTVANTQRKENFISYLSLTTPVTSQSNIHIHVNVNTYINSCANFTVFQKLYVKN